MRWLKTLAFMPPWVDLVDDYTSLPLVTGAYLRSPGGHDGLIEIRTPGFPAKPLELDFTAQEPMIRDDVRECPGPWIDRAAGLKAFADVLAKRGMRSDAAAAMRDRVTVWRRLVDADTANPTYRADLAVAETEATEP